MATTLLVNKIFDRRQVRRLREKTIFLSPPYDFLHKDLEQKLQERVLELSQNFSKILIIGSKTTQFEDHLSGELYFYDFKSRSHQHFSVVGDDEFLPFAEKSFDLVISSAHLHHVNDLESCLNQFHRLLKPGGMILGAVIGEMSLHHLRSHVIASEMELGLGHSAHFTPMLELKTMAQLLSFSGFQDPVCDIDSYELEYSSLAFFIEDLRQMGEGNVLEKRQKTISSSKIKSIFEKKVPIYLDYIFFSGIK